jgi:hypothetical protein
MQLGRATGAIHHREKVSLRTTGKGQLLPDDLDEGYRLAQAKTSMLAARVRDIPVRDLVKQFRQFSFEITNNDLSLDAAVQVHDQLNERIGELLRTLDDADTI